MEDRFYLGWSEQKGRWEVFGWDLPQEPTTDDTGYDDHEGPFETQQEAEAKC